MLYGFFFNLLFWNNTLHVSGGLSVHHQESKTVHTASGTVIQVLWLLASKLALK